MGRGRRWRVATTEVTGGCAAALRVLAAAALALLAAAGTASAHAVGLSRGDYVVRGDLVTAELTFARADAAGLTDASLVRGVVVSGDGVECAAAVDGSEPVAPDGVAWRMRFTCPAAHEIRVRLLLLAELADGHRHVARLQTAAPPPSSPERLVDEVLDRRHDTIALALDGASTGAAPRAAAARTTFAGMVRMGVEHILTGYDHLAFLFGLVLVGGRWRSLLAAVTAFTVAHSITLAAAALGAWAPPPRLVEAAIALSIAYVGIENFFVASAERRWRVTFPFGLVHGFGFASALREVALPRADVPLALLSFNLGVELGQLAVLGALLPLLALLRASPRFAGAGVRALSGATAALGLAWFVARVF